MPNLLMHSSSIEDELFPLCGRKENCCIRIRNDLFQIDQQADHREDKQLDRLFGAISCKRIQHKLCVYYSGIDGKPHLNLKVHHIPRSTEKILPYSVLCTHM